MRKTTFTIEPSTQCKSYLLKLPEIESVTLSDGKRHYQVVDDNKTLHFPSITTILSTPRNQSDTLIRWKERVGLEESAQIARKAAARGTRIHHLVEGYLLGKEQTTNAISFELFQQLRPQLEKIVSVECIEQTLCSRRLGIAGRVDLIAGWIRAGNRSIIDIKTSTNAKYRHDFVIEKYFTQTCAYALMFEEMTGLPAKNLVLIMAIENGNTPQVFEARTNDYVEKLQIAIDNYRKDNQCQENQKQLAMNKDLS